MYPVSIPVHGIALNITVQSYLDKLDFGITADKKAVPDADHMADLLLESIMELKTAAEKYECRQRLDYRSVSSKGLNCHLPSWASLIDCERVKRAKDQPQRTGRRHEKRAAQPFRQRSGRHNGNSTSRTSQTAIAVAVCAGIQSAT
jgi:hypothetical protein